jgi:LuxR family maltose regulon positive regulatory protein
MLYPFLMHPEPELLERHARDAAAHAALIADILGVLAGTGSPSAPPSSAGEEVKEGEAGEGRGLREPLSPAETRVLRYLPTKLSVPEIADQLYLSQNTIRTHMRHMYDKLGAHRRHEAVERARTLGLLATSSRRT